MKQRHLSIALVFCLATCAPVYASAAKTQTINAQQAKNHVGETATVCGLVASTHYAARSRGHATFLNLGRAYPHQLFTVVIWGNNRTRFGQPESLYRNRHVCVTGFISVYHGQPDMILHSPRQIKVK